MGKKLHQTLRSLYHEHGLFAFLLVFVPLLPGIIEHHTYAYLKLIRSLTGSLTHSQPAVKTVFGARGLKTYSQVAYGEANPIYPSHIFNAFFVLKDPQAGIRLLSDLFFDKRQRSQIHSDKHRTKVIQELPSILSAYPGQVNRLVRSAIIRKIALLACVEKALKPRHAILDTFTQLLCETSDKECLIRESKQTVQMNLLAAKIKAELVGRSTAGDPEFLNLTSQTDFPTHILCQTDINLMKQTLTRLAQTPAAEIALKAYDSLQKLNSLDLSLA